MRQNQSLRKVYRLLGLQMMMVALVMAAWFFKGYIPAITALAGGLISIIPNFFWARRFFSKIGTSAPKQIVRYFYLGELLKMIVSVALLVTVACVFKVNLLALFSGFLAAYLGLWFTPLLARQELQRAMAR